MAKIEHITDIIQLSYFPENEAIPTQLEEIVHAFKMSYDVIKSPDKRLSSNGVLFEVSKHLSSSQLFEYEKIYLNSNGNYVAQKGKKLKLDVNLEHYSGKKREFNPDIMSKDGKIIVEVEAGQAVDNYRFLKDLYESMIYTTCEYLVICVRNAYSTFSKNGDVKSTQYDFETISDFMKWLFLSRVSVPLKGLLVIGY